MKYTEANGFMYWTENWRSNILQTALVPNPAPTAISISAARNDTEAFQICCRSSVAGTVESVIAGELKSGSGVISSANASARTVGYYKILSNTKDLLNPVADATALLPEKLLNTSKSEIARYETQPFWISYYIPSDAAPGVYTGEVTLRTTFGDYAVPVTLTVYDAVIPESSEASFSLEMWNQYVKCFEDVSSCPDVINRAYGIEAYSDEWWELMEKFAAFMKRNRMNVLFVNVVDLLTDAPGTSVSESGEVTYDWSLLDRFVGLFIEKAGIKYLSAEHLCAQSVTGGGEKSYKLEVIIRSDGKAVKSYVPIEDGYDYLENYLTELNLHLEQKNWKNIWIQHIGDEPTGKLMAQNYSRLSETVKRICGGVMTGDAFYGENVGEFDDSMDIWIPITALYEGHKSFFDKKRADGDTLWLYTASYPTENYLNRFIDTQLYKTELLAWQCYKSGATGYLHWGLMEWYVWESFSNDDTTAGDNNVTYNGDSWCIYPDTENLGIISSVRVEALREAAEDFELLSLLAKKSPDDAKKLADAMITDGRTYLTDIEAITALREKLLGLVAG